MRKINTNNSYDLWLAKEHYGIDLAPLRKEYGLNFAIRFFKRFFKKGTKKLKPGDRVKILYPKKLKGEYIDFFDLLNTWCGFNIELKTWSEDFVDEDTGEVVTIERFEIEKINLLVKKV